MDLAVGAKDFAALQAKTEAILHPAADLKPLRAPPV